MSSARVDAVQDDEELVEAASFSVPLNTGADDGLTEGDEAESSSGAEGLRSAAASAAALALVRVVRCTVPVGPDFVDGGGLDIVRK